MNLSKGVSIVICTYNGVERLQATLESIFSLKIPSDIAWELIVVDNASTDNTSNFCKKIIDKHGFQNHATIVYEPNPGCNNARLRGLRETKYTWLLFCDDDNHLFPDYIEKAWTILEKTPEIGVLGGQGIALFESEKPDWFEKYAKSFAIGSQASRDGIIDNTFTKLYSAGSFFRKEALMYYYDRNFHTIMVGPKGDDLTRGEDTEWCILIQLQGYRLCYSSELKFYHLMTTSRLSWPYYLKLKKGISSGIAKLESYTLFYKNNYPTNFNFVLLYTRLWLYYNFIWLQFVLRSKIVPNRYNQQEKELGSIVNYTRAASFRKHFKVTYHHFKQLKKFLSIN